MKSALVESLPPPTAFKKRCSIDLRKRNDIFLTFPSKDTEQDFDMLEMIGMLEKKDPFSYMITIIVAEDQGISNYAISLFVPKYPETPILATEWVMIALTSQ